MGIRLYVSTQIWDIFNISQLTKTQSFKLFDDLWGYWYTKFAVLDIQCRFTSDKSDLY